ELGEEWAPVSPVATGRTFQDYERAMRTLMVPALAGAPAPRVRIVTERGSIVLELTPLEAPLTVANFLALVNDGFYTGADLRWHRVVPDFVLQDGDPRGDGNGGPGHAIRDEINRLRYDRGALGMALAGPDTGGSQFFITHSPQPHLDGGYTIFGRVAEGMAVADAVVQGDRILAFEVVQ
ncbi:MAG: peptidylprolyl isomerase, partial [Longimicrobiales bacterium]